MTWLLLAVFALWFAVQLKSGRPDGTAIPVHPYRSIMGHIMPGRNESMVLFDAAIDATELERFIAESRDGTGAHVTHCVVRAVGIALAENPHMNRFASGGRLYQRSAIEISFSMKRKQLDKAAKLAVVKLDLLDGEPFSALCARIDGRIDVQRSDKRTRDDKEFDLLAALPNPVLRLGVALLTALDRNNLLPMAYIRTDPLFCSAFVANLGSLHMAPGYHHLYEWGNCSSFVMIGEIEDRPVVRDGEVVARRILPIRYTYDERIDDGLNARHGLDAVKRVLEDPFTELAG